MRPNDPATLPTRRVDYNRSAMAVDAGPMAHVMMRGLPERIR
jgi:hypothetical protein